MIVKTCETCVHLSRDEKPGYFCAAFPEGVPFEILNGKNPHREHMEGDHGFKWTPLPEFKWMDMPLRPIGKDK